MCECENNVVDLQQLKIYTIMAKYKAISNVTINTSVSEGRITISTSKASQEELAYVYETLGRTDLVEIEEKTNKTRKTDAKKVKETNESEKESGNEEKDKE
tara:strand:- start:155 stop:457 length:303 start_codon:yes stop_codon:yes gene_type:complete